MLSGFALLGILCVISFAEMFVVVVLHILASCDDRLTLAIYAMLHIAVSFIIAVKVIT